jgi:hypothetical protein
MLLKDMALVLGLIAAIITIAYFISGPFFRYPQSIPNQTPTPPSSYNSPSPSPTPTKISPSETPTPSPTVSPSPTPSPTVSPSPTPSPTVSPSPTPAPTPPSITLTSPADGAEISWREYVKGSSKGVVGSNLNLYILIYPIESGGPWWVQPPPTILSNGNWEAFCYFGRDPAEYPEDNGNSFKVISILTIQKLEEGQQWSALPDREDESEMVTVKRSPTGE